MKKSLTALALCGLILPAVAQQLWEKKPVEQWNKKETEKFLRDSPWAKQCLIVYHPLFSEGGKVARVGDTDLESVLQRDLVFVIRWISSDTVRQAMDHHATLTKTFKPSAVRQEHPRGEYHRIQVVGDLQNPLPAVEERTLREGAYLALGRDDRRIPADHVRIRREPGYARPVALDFYFARQSEDGKELIPENVSEVEFIAPVGPRAFRAKFNPSKMRTPNGLEY